MTQGQDGITLRDQFAAQMLPAAIKKAADGINEFELRQMFGARANNIRSEEIVAHLAYMYADAMLAERERHK